MENQLNFEKKKKELKLKSKIKIVRRNKLNLIG